MMMFVSVISSLLGVLVTALLFAEGKDPPNGAVYAAVAAACAWGAAKLYARLKYGKGVIVTFSRRID